MTYVLQTFARSFISIAYFHCHARHIHHNTIFFWWGPFPSWIWLFPSYAVLSWPIKWGISWRLSSNQTAAPSPFPLHFYFGNKATLSPPTHLPLLLPRHRYKLCEAPSLLSAFQQNIPFLLALINLHTSPALSLPRNGMYRCHRDGNSGNKFHSIVGPHVSLNHMHEFAKVLHIV